MGDPYLLCAKEGSDHYGPEWEEWVSARDTSYKMERMYGLLKAEHLDAEGWLSYAIHGPNIRPSYR